MNLGELQAELRQFAAERDWQPFHTPKNLATAVMVEAAELAEIFQWHTPEESRLAHEDTAARQRIGEEIADVLLYLLQLADHCQINVPDAVREKLAMNAVKYPAKRAIARGSPTRTSEPGTHVLLDYENIQPSDAELRALVPDAVWICPVSTDGYWLETQAGLGVAMSAGAGLSTGGVAHATQAPTVGNPCSPCGVGMGPAA